MPLSDPYQQAKQSQIRMTVRRIVEPARYEVRGRRVNPSVNDSGIAKIGGTDDVTWTAARAHIEGPQAFPRVTTLAVKGVASKQLSGVSGGQLRVIGTRILPVWRDGQFVEEPTRSIAWAALDWWRNSDYAAGLSISDIEFPDFVRHAALWDALGHTFDHRFTEVQNLDDVLETVLKAGRAFPAPVGDKLTITRDEPRVLPRMLFTDNDIVRDTLEIDYALSDEAWADGMVGEYVDETTWRLAEVSSAPDGVTLLKPARVQLEGVVNRKQAAGMVRMMAAESQYRRITVSWTARMEGRLLKRGDLVRITTEEPETWGQSCEVVGFQSAARRLTLDPAPAWEAGSNHYVEIRRRDGSPWGPVRVTRGANDAEAIVSVSQVGGVTLADAVGRSDTQEPAWLAFSPGQPRSFPVLITDGDPDQDGEHIHLSGVMDAAEVYTTTEDGVPPLLQIPDLFSSALPVIAALMANIAQRQAALILTAGWQPAKNAVSYEAQVSYDNGGSWIGAYEGDRTTFEAVVGGSDQMKVRARGVTPAGPRGAWSVVDVAAPSLIIGAGTVVMAPIDYEGLTEDVRNRINYILDVERYAIGVAAKAQADFLAADAKAEDALQRAIASLGNDAANTAAITSERTERLTADEAFTSRLDIQVARIDGNTAAIVTEQTARADADGALSTRLDAVLATANGNTAAIISERTARTTADEAFATSLDSVRAIANGNASAITVERTARANGDSANATEISGLRADVNTYVTNLNAYNVETRSVIASGDEALSQRIIAIGATVGQNTAAITGEQKARADGDSALASDINVVRVASDDRFAFFLSENTARFNQTETVANSVEAVRVASDDRFAFFLSENTARFNRTEAVASSVTAVQARTDAGTATGRMTLQASSGIAGVQARFEMLLAAEVGGQTRGTGMTFDLLPGGGSLVRFDADKFVITSPGVSGVPAFSFDAGSGTLSVPYLRLLSQQASTPLRIDIGTYTLIAGAGTVNDQIDANLNFTYLVTNPDFPANIEVFGRLTISGPAGTSLLGMRLIVDGVVAGYFKFNEQNVSVSVGPGNNTFDFRASCIRYLPAGNRSVRIQYNYTSPGAGQVQINELHLAGFQPKA